MFLKEPLRSQTYRSNIFVTDLFIKLFFLNIKTDLCRVTTQVPVHTSDLSFIVITNFLIKSIPVLISDEWC